MLWKFNTHPLFHYLRLFHLLPLILIIGGIFNSTPPEALIDWFV